MTIGSWLANKLSDPEFEAWLDERITVATKAAVAEGLEHLDEQAIALAVADHVVDRVGDKIAAELHPLLDQINKVLGNLGGLPGKFLDDAPKFAEALLAGMVGIGRGAGVGNISIGTIFDNILDGRFPFRFTPPPEQPQ